MAYAFVQAANNGTDGTTATTIAATVSAVGAGNMIAGVVSWGSATAADLTSITDGKGNTYTVVRTVVDSTNTGCTASFYGYNLSGGPTAITANFGSAQPYRSISVMEFSGERTASSPLDGTNEQGQLQTAPGTGTDGAKSGAGTMTPSVNGCLVWGGSVDTGALGSGSSLFTAGTNFTEPANAEHQLSGHVSASSEYWIQTTATAANASFTCGQASAHATLMMIFAPPGTTDTLIGQACL